MRRSLPFLKIVSSENDTSGNDLWPLAANSGTPEPTEPDQLHTLDHTLNRVHSRGETEGRVLLQVQATTGREDEEPPKGILKSPPVPAPSPDAVSGAASGAVESANPEAGGSKQKSKLKQVRFSVPSESEGDNANVAGERSDAGEGSSGGGASGAPGSNVETKLEVQRRRKRSRRRSTLSTIEEEGGASDADDENSDSDAGFSGSSASGQASGAAEATPSRAQPKRRLSKSRAMIKRELAAQSSGAGGEGGDGAAASKRPRRRRKRQMVMAPLQWLSSRKKRSSDETSDDAEVGTGSSDTGGPTKPIMEGLVEEVVSPYVAYPPGGRVAGQGGQPESVLICQASLPEEAAMAGNFVPGLIPPISSPALTYLGSNGAFMHMPFDAPVGSFSLDPRLSPQGGHGWQKELMKTLATSLQLMDIMAGIGDRIGNHKHRNPAAVFPRPWVVDTVIAPSYTEFLADVVVLLLEGHIVPVHTSDYEISPLAAPVLQRYHVKVGDRVTGSGSRQKRIPNWVFGGPYSSFNTVPAGTLPPVNADRCYRSSTYQATVTSPLATILLRDPMQRAPKIDVPSTVVDSLILVRGPKYSKEWTALFMGRPRIDAFLAQPGEGFVHEGISALFHNTMRGPVTDFIEKLKTSILPGHRTLMPFTILIVGHSTGAALGLFLAWFLSKNLKEEVRRRKVKIRCAGFGSPAMADEKAFRRMKIDGAGCWSFQSVLDTMLEQIDAGGGGRLIPGPIISLPVGQLFRAEVPSPSGPPRFLGLSWAFRTSGEVAEQGVSISDVSWQNAISTSALVSHVAVYYCMTTLLAGLYREFEWGSRCAAPFLEGIFPHTSISELYAALEAAHTRVLPQITTRIDSLRLYQLAAVEEKIKSLETAASEQGAGAPV
ncbi:putative lipase domain-containing protein [Neospora caninum Liverpool]|uniref:Putative lipase domain-containing protein n=1 Tax=Neospora caninum (strain Liverpool) TaxID=572307 RepID=F0V9G7_NEOCL|nr:putative lipase domain-containing protein [Neospora caninum Liverpool]CBZ50392.1 putative lipase domain-containing protein [Neospora caninum Liverpool]|eukprot:XP_003880426.1 putative lipase domain-containing protein [Neospora caninum Liverpool]